jgi:hypothetical protein
MFNYISEEGAASIFSVEKSSELRKSGMNTRRRKARPDIWQNKQELMVG